MLYVLVFVLFAIFNGLVIGIVLGSNGVPMWLIIAIAAITGWFLPDLVNFLFPTLKDM